MRRKVSIWVDFGVCVCVYVCGWLRFVGEVCGWLNRL